MPKRRVLSPREQILRAVKKGDLSTVIQLLAKPNDIFLTTEPGEERRILEQTISASAKKGLRAQIEAVLSAALAIDAQILGAQQVLVQRTLNAASAKYGLQDGASAIRSEELDKLLRVEVHVTQLTQTIARVQHVLAVSAEAESLRRDRLAKRQAAHTLRLVDEEKELAHADAAGG